MTDREMIEARCKQEGLTIQTWRDTEDGETALLGRFAVTSNDYEDDGLYESDKGEVSACVVGAEQYNNRRVSFSFTPEGYDSGNEVRDLFVLDPIDD